MATTTKTPADLTLTAEQIAHEARPMTPANHAANIVARSIETNAIASALHTTDLATELASLCDEQNDHGRIMEYRGQDDDGADWCVNLHRAAGG